MSDIDEDNRTGICSVCGPIILKPRYKTYKSGKRAYRCKRKWKSGYKYKQKNKIPYRKHKKNRCEKCGFIPEHKVQLDVDHIDGNKYNNDISNLQTLCANCHRLKTYLNREYLEIKNRPPSS